MVQVEPEPVRGVQVVAHRGSSGLHAEHTVQAYQAAIAEGADALECDVRLTRDGVLVCVHDRTVDRTSDGTGVVSTLELAELADLDFASWKGRSLQGHPLEGSTEVPDTDAGRVLTLENLLRLVLAHQRPVQLHIETKHPTRYGGLVERTLVDLLARYQVLTPPTPALSRITVMSFAAVGLRRMHQLAPKIPTALLMVRVPLRFRDGSLPDRVGIAAPKLDILKAHPAYVARVHAAGGRVHVWTVDVGTDIDEMLALGVDAVISNHPARVLRRLGRSYG